MDTLAQMRESRLPNETGGVLVGSRDRSRKILYVVDALPSPPDSEELKTSYIRGTKGLSEEVERIVRITGSNLDYIGEWHSHPDGHNVEPSANDQKLLTWIRAGMEEAGETGLMCIVGKGNSWASIYHADNPTFGVTGMPPMSNGGNHYEHLPLGCSPIRKQL